MKVLETRSIYFRYPHTNKDAIKNISIELSKGQIVGLLGPNGAGKSTLIKLILGLLPPTKGEIRLFSVNPFTNIDVRKNIGVMHQSPAFEQMMSGWDNLYISGRFLELSRKDVDIRVKEIEKHLGPFTFFERPEISFSGGEKRKLQLVRALLGRPSILLLDEPTTAIDVHGRYQFYIALKDLLNQNEITVLWTSHYLDEIERNCERVIILSAGEVIADAQISQLKQDFSKNRFQIIATPESIEQIPEHIIENTKLNRVSSSTLCFEGFNEKEFYNNIIPILLENGVELQGITKQQLDLEQIYLQLTESVNKS